MRTCLGQNFLIDKNIARKIVNFAEISQSEVIVEIGPGHGILTEEIIKHSDNLIAIEIDKNLIKYLSEKFKNKNNITIVESNFLKWVSPSRKRLKFIANLPYYISSAIIEKILHLNNWEIAVFMVQKEVAARLKANPNTAEYGVLSIACQVFCEVEKIFDVPPNCFQPKPKVTSSVIKLKRLKKWRIEKNDEEIFFRIVKNSFAHRRKTILNSLLMELNIDKNKIQKKLLEANIFPTMRAETLSIEDFVRLTRIIKDEIDL
jgi:16S rRNA (adenine1518-N6/adenine1519-N6)-dimethyltransferase